MTAFFYELALFASKWLVVAGAIIFTFSVIVAMRIKARGALNEIQPGNFKITNLSDKYQEMTNQLSTELFEEKFIRTKQEKIAVVLDFVGNLQAQQVKHFREEINAILLLRKNLMWLWFVWKAPEEQRWIMDTQPSNFDA